MSRNMHMKDNTCIVLKRDAGMLSNQSFIMSLQEEPGTVLKPTTLETSEIQVHAPLASPDVSTISESSESSSGNTNNGSSENGERSSARLSTDSQELGLDVQSVDDSIPDSDSCTSGSVSTVIAAVGAGLPSPGSKGGKDCLSLSSDTDRTIESLPASPTEESQKPADALIEPVLNLPSQTSTASDAFLNLEESASDLEVTLQGHTEDSTSETDTESTVEGSVDSERQPLLKQQSDGALYQDNDGQQSSEFSPSESDDTDSMSTPTDSPSKGRLESVKVTPPSHLQSQGLCTFVYT